MGSIRWVLMPGTGGWDDHMPLCRSCHVKYDYDARYTGKPLEKWRASAGPAIAAAWTVKRRQRQSERVKRLRKIMPTKHDPVTGRFMPGKFTASGDTFAQWVCQ